MNLELLRAYVGEHALVQQHLSSFSRFCRTGLQSIMDEIGEIEPDVEGFKLKLGKVRLEKPRVVEADGAHRSILPMEARLRSFNYAAPIFLTITPIENGVERRPSEVYIGELPVMLKSELCHVHGLNKEQLIEAGEDPDDLGGYFIINGGERAIVSVEDLAPNKVMVGREETTGKVNAKVLSTNTTKGGFRAKCMVQRRKLGELALLFPAAPRGLKLTTVLRALGLSSDAEIMASFNNSRLVRNDILLNLEDDECKNAADAVEAIGRRAAPGQATEYRQRRTEILLDRYLLPHIGLAPEDRLAKAKYLCWMAEKAMAVAYHRRRPDDKDHYGNKRIKLAGDLMEDLFRHALTFLVKDIIYQSERASARRRKLVVQTVVRPDALNIRIKHAMATGNWVGGHTGVSSTLDRLNFIASGAHLRRVISSLSKSHPHFQARDLHGTHWGKLCPHESPEGPGAGLVKNLAMMVEIATGETPESEVEAVFRRAGVKGEK